MKLKQKLFGEQGAIVFFAVVFMAAVYSASSNHFGMIYIDLGDGRGPAAIGRVYDVSALEGKALSRKVNEQLIGEAHVLKEGKKIGLELGQFVTESKGKKMLACSVYDRVELVFQSEGEATAGEVPQMSVEGACRNSAEKLLWMQPIWIPVGDLLQRSPATSAIDFFDQEPVSLRFENLGDQWPRRWVLNRLILHDDHRPGENITIERSAIRAANPKSLIIEF
ncbi:MAG: hypothetical protein AB7N80_06145 [Bdellovibrionales bacterium]